MLGVLLVWKWGKDIDLISIDSRYKKRRPLITALKSRQLP